MIQQIVFLVIRLKGFAFPHEKCSKMVATYGAGSWRDAQPENGAPLTTVIRLFFAAFGALSTLTVPLRAFSCCKAPGVWTQLPSDHAG